MARRFVSARLVCLCCLGAGHLLASDMLVLVENGESRMPIVIFENAPPMTRRAADELAEYIEKVSGTRPKVLEGTPDPLPAQAVWVGMQPALTALFPGLDIDFDHPEEILIAANRNHLVIAGRDRWDPDHLTVEFPGPGRSTRVVDGIQQEYGTCNAVYTFLQDYLGIRWLWPGELGEDVPRKDTIAFAPFEYRHHPQFRSRSGILRLADLFSWRGISHEWSRFQRLQLDSLTLTMGHPFAGWWNRFHETHPDFFALQPDGTRGGGAKPYPNARTVKLCTANPGMWAQWLADVEQELERNPTRNMFSVSQNDSAYSGYCICEKCRAWDHPDQEMVRYTWQGLTQEYVAQSDRMVTFANTLARMLKERFPERDDILLGFGTYGNAHPVPIEVVPDGNVIVGVFANIHNRPFAEEGRGTRKNLADWSRSGAKNIRWGANMGGSAGWQLGFPNVSPRRAIDDMRFAAEHNVIGVAFDTMWEHWINQGPHYYMLAQMGWNPYADGEAILADYYRRAYGPAADSMTAFWELMDATSDQIVFGGRSMDEVWPASPAADFYQQACSLLDHAAAALAGADSIYDKRVARQRAGLDYLRLYRENQQLIARLQQAKGNDVDALATARANWQQILRIWEQYPHAFSGYIRPREDGKGHLEQVNPDRRGRTWG